MTQASSFHSHRGGDDRHTKCHALIDFSFHARAETQWSNRKSDAVEKRTHVPLQSRDDDLLGCQRNDLWGHLVSYDVKFCIPKRSLYQRINFLQKEENSVDIWRMLETTNEQPVAAECERRIGTWNIDNIRD